MGGNVSREVTITDDKSPEAGMTKSSTLPATFRGLPDDSTTKADSKTSWAGTLPRGMSFDANESFGKRLRKTFKKFEVTPSKSDSETKSEVIEEVADESTVTDFIESMLADLIEEATEGISDLDTSRSSTFRNMTKGLGLNRNQSFGKRIRKSIRKLVIKTPKKNKKVSKETMDFIESLIDEVLNNVTGVVESDEESFEKIEKPVVSTEEEENIEKELVEKMSSLEVTKDISEEPIENTTTDDENKDLKKTEATESAVATKSND